MFRISQGTQAESGSSWRGIPEPTVLPKYSEFERGHLRKREERFACSR